VGGEKREKMVGRKSQCNRQCGQHKSKMMQGIIEKFPAIMKCYSTSVELRVSVKKY
jgi:hypothetical protein